MRHDSYLPSFPATLQALDRMEYAMVNAIAPPDVRIVGPHIVVSSYSPSVPGHKQKLALKPYTLWVLSTRRKKQHM